MNSKIGTFAIVTIACIALFLIGGFILNHAAGMICVLVAIAIFGLAAGSIMDSPEPESK